MRSIEARFVKMTEENDVLVVSFADDAESPTHWFILQRTLEPSEDDVDLGQDQVHISVDSNPVGLYGGVVHGALTHDALVLRLSAAAGNELQTGDSIWAELKGAQVDRAALGAALRRALQPVPLEISDR
jgi:Immunity protein 10